MGSPADASDGRSHRQGTVRRLQKLRLKKEISTDGEDRRATEKENAGLGTGGTQVCSLAITRGGDKNVRKAPLLGNQTKPIEKEGDGKGHPAY